MNDRVERNLLNNRVEVFELWTRKENSKQDWLLLRRYIFVFEDWLQYEFKEIDKIELRLCLSPLPLFQTINPN